MKRLIAFALCAALSSGGVLAQERGTAVVAEERAAVEAWTQCIADEQPEKVAELLAQDFRTTSYRIGLRNLAQARVSTTCFEAMPRDYRRVQLGGLPFAGGLAERMIERDETPLLTRLSMAVLKPETETYSRTDEIAMCMIRGAPDRVAILFDSAIESPEESAALAQLQPIADACTRGTARLEASALGLRSMLATAAYRLLAAPEDGR